MTSGLDKEIHAPHRGTIPGTLNYTRREGKRAGTAVVGIRLRSLKAAALFGTEEI